MSIADRRLMPRIGAEPSPMAELPLIIIININATHGYYVSEGRNVSTENVRNVQTCSGTCKMESLASP